MQDFLERLIHLIDGRGGLWLVLLAMWGGTVRYVMAIRKDGRQFKFTSLFIEWIVSGFTGVLTAYMCFSAGASWQVTCFIVGVAGHMGGRALYLLEKKFKNYLGVKDE
jgi:hypothetical protein